MLTITGLLLLVSFLQVTQQPGPPPLPYFVGFAIPVIMRSVGLRYTPRGFPEKAPNTALHPQQDPAHR